MMKTRLLGWLGMGLLTSVWLQGASPPAREVSSAPPFNEVFELLRTNLTDWSAAELNRAAVEGLLGQFAGRVTLTTNTSVESPELIESERVFNEAYAYCRIARVDPGLADAFHSVLDRLKSNHLIRGLILDLRFSQGKSYGEAAALADRFLMRERPLLQWGERTARSQAKSDAIAWPVVILVNGSTRGAAEALAGILRSTETALLIGRPTSGEAYDLKTFTLSGGQQIEVAAGLVVLGDGRKLSGHPVEPDIRVSVDPEIERAYLEDPYRERPREIASTAESNREARRRLNEADLVRIQREGIGLDEVLESRPADEDQTPVVNDPSLARALDFLKGLAIVQNRP